MIITFVLFFIFLSSFFITDKLRGLAIRANVIDVPNDRSSHSIPTPRGGGVAIIVSFLTSLFVFYFLDLISFSLALPLMLSAIITAIIGAYDDLRHVKAEIRLLFHLLSSIILVVFLTGFPHLTLFVFSIQVSYVTTLLSIFFSIWMINLFNFMDGIDGLAGIEALFSTVVMGLILFIVFEQKNLAILHFSVSASVLGFLVWNFPTSKIFMGDAGSGFLGLILVALIYLSGQVSENLFWSWLVLLGVFIVDATFTLLVRMLNGNKPHKAHRSHAYQFASRRFSHIKVSLCVLSINLLWLTPIALGISILKLDGFIWLLIAYSPLLILALFFKAGKPVDNN